MRSWQCPLAFSFLLCFRERFTSSLSRDRRWAQGKRDCGGAGSGLWVRGEEGAPSPAPGTAPPAPCCVSGGPRVAFVESRCAVTLVLPAVEVQDGVAPPRSVSRLHLKKEPRRLGTNLVRRWAGPGRYPVMSGAPPERERLWGVTLRSPASGCPRSHCLCLSCSLAARATWFPAERVPLSPRMPHINYSQSFANAETRGEAQITAWQPAARGTWSPAQEP